MLTKKIRRYARASKCQLRPLRKAVGMNPLFIAEELGVGESTVWNWESGDHIPDAIVCSELCELLDCTLEDLYPRDEK